MAAACSSGSGHSAGAGPATTGRATATGSKAAFLAAANSLCKVANARTQVLHAGVPPNPTGQDQAYALDKGSDVIAAALDQMKKLDQPTGDRANLALFYQRSQQLLVLDPPDGRRVPGQGPGQGHLDRDRGQHPGRPAHARRRFLRTERVRQRFGSVIAGRRRRSVVGVRVHHRLYRPATLRSHPTRRTH